MNRVEKLFAVYSAGLLTELWLCSAFVTDVEPEDVDKYMKSFPVGCLDRLRNMVSHDPSPDDVNIGGGPPVRKEVVTAIRDWLNRNETKHPVS